MPTLTELNLYPIKSCAGIALQEATLTPMGLMSYGIHDREWMVVDADGEAMTQREFPRMALVVPHVEGNALVLSAPDMPQLRLPLARENEANAQRVTVQIWDDQLDAGDCGDATAQWFSAVIGTPCRLVRFAAGVQRLASAKWTDGLAVPTHFADAFPMLVIGSGSLDDLNDKLRAHGRDALPMNRFRPNIVIGDLPAFEEDFAETCSLESSTGKDKIVLKPVKPCARCPMPSVDQSTGTFGPDPMDILRSYRANPKVDGGITFGMNAILLEGAGNIVRVGQAVEVNLAF
jgi:uncharacterized protein YcbX